MVDILSKRRHTWLWLIVDVHGLDIRVMNAQPDKGAPIVVQRSTGSTNPVTNTSRNLRVSDTAYITVFVYLDVCMFASATHTTYI